VPPTELEGEQEMRPLYLHTHAPRTHLEEHIVIHALADSFGDTALWQPSGPRQLAIVERSVLEEVEVAEAVEEHATRAGRRTQHRDEGRPNASFLQALAPPPTDAG
jgi:hypothetical protein